MWRFNCLRAGSLSIHPVKSRSFMYIEHHYHALQDSTPRPTPQTACDGLLRSSGRLPDWFGTATKSFYRLHQNLDQPATSIPSISLFPQRFAGVRPRRRLVLFVVAYYASHSRQCKHRNDVSRCCLPMILNSHSRISFQRSVTSKRVIGGETPI